MTREQKTAAMRRVLSETIGLDEVRHVTTFKAVRGDDRVIVEIEDAGSDVDPSMRFRCYAKPEDGGRRFATGNPAETAEMAMIITQWGNLDKPAVR